MFYDESEARQLVHILHNAGAPIPAVKHYLGLDNDPYLVRDKHKVKAKAQIRFLGLYELQVAGGSNCPRDNTIFYHPCLPWKNQLKGT